LLFLYRIFLVNINVMEKIRKYSEDYLKFGFSSVINNGIEKPQCVLCNAVLSVESMKPSKLKRHLETKHSEFASKDVDFFKGYETQLKRQKLDISGIFQPQNQNVIQASYEIALEIAKNKKPYTIAEKLIKPCLLRSVNLILGEASERKMRNISLSNSTIQKRISDMSEDVQEQILTEIRASPLFSLQLDESTDVSSCSQLLVFVKYIHCDDIKEEFLFCRPLKTTTKSADIMGMICSFFESKELLWENLCGVCTDGAPIMLGSKSGFQKRVKELAPLAKGLHCIIHRFALATKTLPKPLQEVLDSLVKIVNYIKSSALNTRLFRDLCKNMNADHEALLFYTPVRWLSKGNVVERVFELKNEIKYFLEMQGKQDFMEKFNNNGWIQRTAYLSDIFGQLNTLNLKLQGKEMHLIQYRDKLQAFVSKLENWRRKANLGNFAMFEHLCTMAEASERGVVENLAEEINGHLQSLEKEIQRYFPELSEQEASVVRNPFHAALDVANIPEEVQDEFIELRNDSIARDLFKEKSLTEFWCSMRRSYPNVALLSFKLLVPFASTYLCESGFSTLLQIKTKSRNRLDVQDDMRLALSNTQPRISKLVKQIQAQPSH
jgi:zinc finger BED domain-containing protein 5/7/8/9